MCILLEDFTTYPEVSLSGIRETPVDPALFKFYCLLYMIHCSVFPLRVRVNAEKFILKTVRMQRELNL